MTRLRLLPAVILAGCNLLAIENPSNCMDNPNACGRDMFCNQVTQSCETLDCTVNTDLCQASEYCDQGSRRCMPKNCVIDQTLCTANQICEPVSMQCQTRMFVLGQPDTTSNLNTAYGMSSPSSVLLVADPADNTKTKLLVGDGGGGDQRVLVWNDVPTQNRPADAVFGMPDVNTLSGNGPYGGINELSLVSPWSIASDGTRVIIGDQSLNRLLIWNQIPTAISSAGPPAANRVWGQTDFSGGLANGGKPQPDGFGVSFPRAFLERAASGLLFVVDNVNHRVLILPGIPSSSQTAPVSVLGQSSFFGNTPGSGLSNLASPRGVVSNGVQAFVTDTGNNRVLGYTGLQANQFAPAASTLIGQAGAGNSSPNRGRAMPDATTLSTPHAVWLLAGASPSLLVTDLGNNRVLRFPLSSPLTADLVLGQPNFVSNAPNGGGAQPSAATLFNPIDVSSDGTRLAVADRNNNRVLIWQNLPTQNGQAADVVLGQPDFTSTVVNNPPTRSALQFRGPQQVATDGTRLAITDTMNHRVLLWLTLPRDGTTAPDVVLGQPDMVSNQQNASLPTPSAATLAQPAGVSLDGGMLAIADTGNNRVLLFAQVPTHNYTGADYVLGQPDPGSVLAQPPASGVSAPGAVLLSQGHLYVADTGYNRVLGYNTPFRVGATPDLVLGQPSLAVTTANNGGLSARTLVSPRSLAISSSNLLVADRGNHRVLIWNSLPTTNFQPASVVVGQTDFANAYTRVDRSHINAPSGVLFQNNRLYVTSAVQNRILYWNQLPTANGQPADGVLGQGDFLSSLPNNPDLMPIEKLSSPLGLAATADQLFVADSLNNRVVVRGLL